MQKNFIFISPNFPKTYYQFPLAWKQLGGRSLAISDANYNSLSDVQKSAFDDYYQVSSLENYDEVYRAVAWFAHRYGKIDWLESNNEYWLFQDAKLRQDFNITTGDKADDVMHYKLKSEMKAYYHKANVPTARYHIVSTYEAGKDFISKVGYPVVVKPNNGVGSSATWKIRNDGELEDFYKIQLPNEYIMEEYIPGYILSFDGIVDENNKIVYRTCHVFPNPVMEIVNEKTDCIFWNEIDMPKDLNQMGEKLIHAFDLRSRFFHTEYFRMTEDKEGLGKKGDLIGLEVNMRPPGGYMTDMINYSQDINIYMIYAKMCMHVQNMVSPHPIYHCVHVGKRDGSQYAHSGLEIFQRFGANIVMHERMPQVLDAAMGNEFYVARFKTMKELHEFVDFVTEKEVKPHADKLPQEL